MTQLSLFDFVNPEKERILFVAKQIVGSDSIRGSIPHFTPSIERALPMGKTILSIYVAVQTFVIVISMISSVSEGEAVHVLDKSDWWMFIVSCGVLAICEAMEGVK